MAMVTLSNPGREHRVDFLRGVALVTIFINHIPGNYWGRFTHANYSPGVCGVRMSAPSKVRTECGAQVRV